MSAVIEAQTGDLASCIQRDSRILQDLIEGKKVDLFLVQQVVNCVSAHIHDLKPKLQSIFGPGRPMMLTERVVQSQHYLDDAVQIISLVPLVRETKEIVGNGFTKAASIVANLDAPLIEFEEVFEKTQAQQDKVVSKL